MTITYVPSRKPYFIRSEHKELLTAVGKISATGRNVNILVTGPAGCGKSELPNQFAAMTGRPLAVLEIGLLSESKEIFGHTILKDGKTEFVKGLFLDAITTPNCVVHLQEINRPDSDKALNAIFSVLDPTFRGLWLEELGERVEVASGVTFWASMNEGFEFVGTMPLDQALEDRFQFKLVLGYLPRQFEETLVMTRTPIAPLKLAELMNFIEKLRTNGKEPWRVGTRDVLYMAELVQYGISPFLALKSVVSGSPKLLEDMFLSQHIGGATTNVTSDTDYCIL